jgi:hypothetical protein
MTGYKQIILSLVWIFFFWVAVSPAMKSTDSQENVEEIISQDKGVVEHKIFFLVENDSDPEEEKAAGSTESEESNQKTKPKKGNAASKSRKKTAPLNPFVPSEKVKAGQAVDFPYDI